MTPITTTSYLAGKHKLPAGAVPLCRDEDAGGLVCQTPAGLWIRWNPAHEETPIDPLPLRIQTSVVKALTTHFGGRREFATALGISVRAVDAWKRCVQTMPVRAAEQIARLLA